MARKTAQKGKKTQQTPGRVRTWLRERFAGSGPVVLRALFWMIMVSAVLVTAAVAMDAMERQVRRQRAQVGAIRYHVELQGVPDWVPQSLVRHVLEDITPTPETAPYFEDDSLCQTIYQQALQSPWIASVESVQRDRLALDRGVVRVTATWRCAVAYVRYEQRVYYVDTNGYVLPDSQVPRWAVIEGDRTRCYLTADSIPETCQASAVHYFALAGVTTPPPAVGEVWQAEDLQAGLQLIRLISDRSWANQIACIDVRNFQKRLSESDPELQMVAQMRLASRQSRCTEIRFGRFPRPEGGDWVISPERKVEYLDHYVENHDGCLAGVHAALDVRMDNISLTPYSTN